jgi:hypothetical protein
MSMTGLAGLPGKIKTLLDRLTPTRASNLDNLNVAVGTRASSTEVAKAASYTADRALLLDNLDEPISGIKGGLSAVEFTTVGSQSWPVPSNITVVYITMIAGGGGGGGGGSEATSGDDGTGGGGGSSAMSCHRVPLYTVPNQNLTVNVGAGGPGGPGGVAASSGSGANGSYGTNGGASYVEQDFGANVRVTVIGGNGGDYGHANEDSYVGSNAVPAAGSPYYTEDDDPALTSVTPSGQYNLQSVGPYMPGASGGQGGKTGINDPQNPKPGGYSCGFAGGASGTSNSSGDGGGGGGASRYGNGGAGGNGRGSSNATPGSAGTGYGTGGGGGGGGNSYYGNKSGGDGGDGGQGYILIEY